MEQIIKRLEGAEEGKAWLCKAGKFCETERWFIFYIIRMLHFFFSFVGRILLVLYENVFLPLFVQNHLHISSWAVFL